MENHVKPLRILQLHARDDDIMTIVLDAEWVGGAIGAMITVIITAVGYLQTKGYIAKWKSKLSISNEVADEVIRQNHSALAKLKISDDILQVLQTHATDKTGMIDHNKLITVLDNYKRIHQLVTLKRLMTPTEQEEVCSIVFRILEDHKPEKKNMHTQPHYDQQDN